MDGGEIPHAIESLVDLLGLAAFVAIVALRGVLFTLLVQGTTVCRVIDRRIGATGPDGAG